MGAHEWTFREPNLLAALERVFGRPLPARELLPAERRAHEAAFECEAPEPVHPRFDDPDDAASYYYRGEVSSA